MNDGRRLTDAETAILDTILSGDPFPGADVLAAQVSHAMVVGGIPTLLELWVPRDVQRAPVANGVPTTSGSVAGREGDDPIAFLYVWVTDGYLSGLECAWLMDDLDGMPPPGRVRQHTRKT
jgi:hypothetical protein